MSQTQTTADPIGTTEHSHPTQTARRVNLNIPGDMVLYAALTGREPTIDPDLADPMIAASEARRENPWSPTVLSIYLRQVCVQHASRINKPEIAAWIKRQSVTARRRLVETQVRVIPARPKQAA